MISCRTPCEDVVEGKSGRAPCGHRGEAIIGQYYQCLQGCDSTSAGVPEVVEAEQTEDYIVCPNCGHTDPIVYPHLYRLGETGYWCRSCGEIWTAGP